MRTKQRSAEAATKAPVVPKPRAPSRRPHDLDALADRLRHRAEETGLAAIGIARATPMATTRRILEERKAAGLSGGMQFTYRNPARSADPGRALTGAAALVVGAWPYATIYTEGAAKRHSGASSVSLVTAGGPGSGGVVTPGRPMGRVARYARRDHYQGLRDALSQVATEVIEAGWRARVVADDNALVDRAAAERAGLGWFGKNSNILLPGRGSWFLLGSVITDAPLPPGSPVGDGCGSCRRCLSSCPTGALVAPGVLDARKCLAWLLQATGVFPFEYRVSLEGRIYGCDDCQEVCPANRLAARMAGDGPGWLTSQAGEEAETAAPAGAAGTSGAIGATGTTEAADEAEVDLLQLLSAGDMSLMARYGRWYIPQRDPRYLRRNALIALGNIADGWRSDVETTLQRYLDDPDELLRSHAVWAAFRAGRHDLVACRPNLVDDQSPFVREELARQGEVPVRSTATIGGPR
jgi:epoxyqueuosine reductase